MVLFFTKIVLEFKSFLTTPRTLNLESRRESYSLEKFDAKTELLIQSDVVTSGLQCCDIKANPTEITLVVMSGHEDFNVVISIVRPCKNHPILTIFDPFPKTL